MRALFQTDKGKIRKLNEDSGGVHLNKTGQYLAIIADGMGGHQAGEVASQLTHDVFYDAWLNEEKITTAHQAEEWLLAKIIKANKKIYEYAKNNKDYTGMGTTIVVAICTGEFLTIGHVGDSRGYLLNETGFKQLTEDDSLVNELIKSGEINKTDAEKHPQKNVLLKALGTDIEIKPTFRTISWEKDNRLLLCSDGLSNKLTDLELSNIIKVVKTKSDIEEELIGLANERGGEDNITIALIIKGSSSEVGED